jgi:hypothetical protein
MRKLTWLDAEMEGTYEDELNRLEDDQDFLEQFYGVSMLLDAISGPAHDEEECYGDLAS